jgi:flagellar hook protein FlgE
MLIALDSAVSALDQFQQDLNVIGNNIANVDTVGFKSSSMNFEDTFSQTLGSNAAGTMQVGTGVQISDIAGQFTQGSISSTGVPSNLAVNGNGFFLVKDPVSGAEYATRDGNFSVDSSGNLVTSSGMRVQGYNNSALSTIGDININTAAAASGDTSGVQSYNFSSNGKLNILMADGINVTGGQVLLQNYTSPQQLLNVGNNLFSNLTAAGPLPAAAAPGNSGLGQLATSSLEESNVDLAGQLTNLITTQRAYEANAKVVTTGDEVLQDVVNLKR